MPESVSTLGHLLSLAEADLTAATGGRALCRISAAGAPTRSVKFLEGAWAALRSLALAIDSDSLDAAAAAERLRVEWRTDLLSRSSHPESPWIPYREGGISALDTFLAEHLSETSRRA
jgi:hypothetical protein